MNEESYYQSVPGAGGNQEHGSKSIKRHRAPPGTSSRDCCGTIYCLLAVLCLLFAGFCVFEYETDPNGAKLRGWLGGPLKDKQPLDGSKVPEEGLSLDDTSTAEEPTEGIPIDPDAVQPTGEQPEEGLPIQESELTPLPTMSPSTSQPTSQPSSEPSSIPATSQPSLKPVVADASQNDGSSTEVQEKQEPEQLDIPVEVETTEPAKATPKDTEPPASQETEPEEEIDPDIVETKSPVKETELLVEDPVVVEKTKPPVTETEPPVVETEPPVVETEPPVAETTEPEEDEASPEGGGG